MGSAKAYCAVVRRYERGTGPFIWSVTFYADADRDKVVGFRQSNVTNHIKDKLKSMGFKTRVEWSRIQDGSSVQLHF